MKTALLVIDVQMALAHEDAAGADRSCPQANENITSLLSSFRAAGEKIIHIHHHGLEKDDPFHSEAPGALVQPFAAPKGNEPVFIKNVSSGFMGTPLEQELRKEGVERLVLCGATANHCVESTTRHAAGLGFDALYASDAVWAYGVTGPDGVEHSGEQVHSVTLSTIQGEFAEVLPTAEILQKIA